jgi:hypothetical protein
MSEQLLELQESNTTQKFYYIRTSRTHFILKQVGLAKINVDCARNPTPYIFLIYRLDLFISWFNVI